MYEWLSECCDAIPVGEIDSSFETYPIGFCSKCLDNCGFYRENWGDEND